MTEDNRTGIPDRQGNSKEYRVGYKNPPRETQWKPGESGNPEGRPPDFKYISDYLREILPQDCGDGRTWGQKIAEEWVKQAADTKARGNVPAREEVLDRTEGRVPETHKIESDVPITIIFKEVEKV